MTYDAVVRIFDFYVFFVIMEAVKVFMAVRAIRNECSSNKSNYFLKTHVIPNV